MLWEFPGGLGRARGAESTRGQQGGQGPGHGAGGGKLLAAFKELTWLLLEGAVKGSRVEGGRGN